MTDPYATLRALLRDLDALRDHGCSDGNCKMRRKIGGMHTNGGCNCIQRLSDIALHIAAEADRVKRYIGAPLGG